MRMSRPVKFLSYDELVTSGYFIAIERYGTVTRYYVKQVDCELPCRVGKMKTKTFDKFDTYKDFLKHLNLI